MLIVLIHNDGTGTKESANYTYEVRVNDKVLERGNIKGHNRSDGWRSLLGEIGEGPAARDLLREIVKWDADFEDLPAELKAAIADELLKE